MVVANSVAKWLIFESRGDQAAQGATSGNGLWIEALAHG
jgi:hypothetical protein